MKKLLFLAFLILNSFCIKAQETFSISGIVINPRGEPMQAATVFIDGSKKITVTNNNGEFKFINLNPGTYQLVVNMLGYFSAKQNIIIQQQPVISNITLKEKQIALAEVVIGVKSDWEENLQLFTKNFIGESKNAKACKILNAEILNFTNNKSHGILEAQSEDFLVIENKKLGYRIKYLLRNFQYNRITTTASYDGESIFENLEGSDTEQQQWKENRNRAYEGSFMHYLRTVYHNTSQEEGFITYVVKNNQQPLRLNPTPVNMEEYILTVDKDFIELSFKKILYVRFDKKKASTPHKPEKKGAITQAMGNDGSVIRLFLENAVIDSKGSYVDYRSFFVQGFWGRKRIADQLPFEYVINND